MMIQIYDPDNHPQSSCDPLNCHEMKNIYDLAHLLTISENHLSSEIIKVLKLVSNLNLNDQDQLYKQLTLLIKVNGPDCNFIKDN